MNFLQFSGQIPTYRYKNAQCYFSRAEFWSLVALVEKAVKIKSLLEVFTTVNWEVLNLGGFVGVQGVQNDWFHQTGGAQWEMRMQKQQYLFSQRGILSRSLSLSLSLFIFGDTTQQSRKNWSKMHEFLFCWDTTNFQPLRTENTRRIRNLRERI